jgi:hypothetical protein
MQRYAGLGRQSHYGGGRYRLTVVDLSATTHPLMNTPWQICDSPTLVWVDVEREAKDDGGSGDIATPDTGVISLPPCGGVSYTPTKDA